MRAARGQAAPLRTRFWPGHATSASTGWRRTGARRTSRPTGRGARWASGPGSTACSARSRDPLDSPKDRLPLLGGHGRGSGCRQRGAHVSKFGRDLFENRTSRTGGHTPERRRAKLAEGARICADQPFDLGARALQQVDRLFDLDGVFLDVRRPTPLPEPDRDRKSRPAAHDFEVLRRERRVSGRGGVKDVVKLFPNVGQRACGFVLLFGEVGSESIVGGTLRPGLARLVADGEPVGAAPRVAALRVDDVPHRSPYRPLVTARVGVEVRFVERGEDAMQSPPRGRRCAYGLTRLSRWLSRERQTGCRRGSLEQLEHAIEPVTDIRLMLAPHPLVDELLVVHRREGVEQLAEGGARPGERWINLYERPGRLLEDEAIEDAAQAVAATGSV